jgi:hypothetical protein
MARKKTSESSPTLTLGTVASEDTQVINSADMEAQEAELLNDEENESEVKDSELTEASKTKSTPTEAMAEDEEAKPKRQRRARKTAPKEIAEGAELDLSEEVKIAKDTVEVTMHTLVAQMTTIKEITTGINTQIEKMHFLVKEMSPTQNPNLEELVKPQISSQFVAKFATAASLVAMLVSILSMSMAQSARQTILSAKVNTKENTTIQASNLKESPSEIALATKELIPKRRAKK